MEKQLFIPEKINVGFQERSDTYTGLLGFIIYWDKKGVLRQETSWNGWRNKPEEKTGGQYIGGMWTKSDETYGEKVRNQIHDNVPTEGFVLNKKAGGYSSGWNHRQAVCRVYDPRGFEFEISVDNLLYILECTNSIIGKGLEGKFVYSWDATKLVLLPVSSQEFKQSTEFTDLQDKKIGRKDMLGGCIYTTKKQEVLTYLGRFDYTTLEYSNGQHSNSTSKKHIFIDSEGVYHTHNGFTKLAIRNTTTPSDDYSDLIEEYQLSVYGSEVVGIGSDVTNLTLPIPNDNGDISTDAISCNMAIKYAESGDYSTVRFLYGTVYNYGRQERTKEGYRFNMVRDYRMVNDKILIKYRNHYESYTDGMTKEEMESKVFHQAYVQLKSGTKIGLEDYFNKLYYNH